MNTNLLKLENVSVKYDEIEALHGVTIEVKRNSITSLVGANGSGKSTLLNAISGIVSVSEGTMVFDGQNIEALPPHECPGLGVIQVPEGRRIFPYMTVKENLEIGSLSKHAKSERKGNLDKVMDMFPILAVRAKQLGGTLSGGEQQMLAIGRALMGIPKLLMLDEPSLGLAPIIVTEIFSIIEKISESGTTILLVEQNVRKSLEIADYGYVLENGHMVLSGDAKDVLENDMTRKAYIGI